MGTAWVRPRTGLRVYGLSPVGRGRQGVQSPPRQAPRTSTKTSQELQPGWLPAPPGDGRGKPIRGLIDRGTSLLEPGRGIPRLGARGHEVGLGGFRRFPQLPHMQMLNERRADIESPFGGHQCGLRNTLPHCLLVHHLVGLGASGQEVLEERSGTAVRLITSMDVRF
jgi:hypothetical protein